MGYQIKVPLRWMAIVMTVCIIGGCATTRHITIKSNPPGALVMVHNQESVDSSIVTYCGETPRCKNFSFYDKGSCFATVEKRGFKSVSQKIDENSDSIVMFNLSRIQGVSDSVIGFDLLSKGHFCLLPLEAVVTIKSGVGALDKLTFSREKSEKATRMLDAFFVGKTQSGGPECRLHVLEDKVLADEWRSLYGEISNYTTALDTNRLRYYGCPPCLNTKDVKYNSLCAQTLNACDSSMRFIVYLKVSCISETSGRKAANIALSIVGAASSRGASTYNPEALKSSSKTSFLLFVIDAFTTEIAHIENRWFNYDITDDKTCRALSETIIGTLNNLGINQTKTAAVKENRHK